MLAGSGCGTPSGAPPAPPAVRPPSAQTPPADSPFPPASGRELTIWQPAAGTVVTTPVRVAGQVTELSGAVSAIVRDDHGKELGRGSTSLTAGDPAPLAFSFEVHFSPAGGNRPASVEVFTLNAADGSVQQRTRIAVRLGQ